MFDSDFGYNIVYIWEYCMNPSQVTQKAVDFEWRKRELCSGLRLQYKQPYCLGIWSG